MALVKSAETLDEMKAGILKWVFVMLAWAQNAQAMVVDDWLEDIGEIKRGLSLPVQDHLEYVHPSSQMLLERLHNVYGRIDNEEPSFYIGTAKANLEQFVKEVAIRGKRRDLYRLLLQKKKASEKRMRVSLTDEMLKLVDLQALLEKAFVHSHHRLLLDAEALIQDPQLAKKLVAEIRPFMNRRDLVDLADKLEHQKSIEIDRDLLPPFARMAVKNFSHFKGPNCFHAALAFQDPSIPKTPLFNASRKGDYHWQMINYDELWRVLENSFYEVHPESTALKYGDVLVFFDSPEELNPGAQINFHWIKHAAVYLFGEYTFSKGSKSANSTYTVNTLAEEFEGWQNRLNHLTIKIFRKSLIRVKNLPYVDQHDWFF